MNIQFHSPAVYWTEALPVGNGRLGAMIFGGVEKERIALNEDTLWSGYPKDWNNPGAKEVLPKVRELIAQEKYEEADRLCKEMMGPYTQSYLPFGDLRFVMDHGNVNHQYSRKLDLSTGIVTVPIPLAAFSIPEKYLLLIPIKPLSCVLTSSKEGMLSFRAWLDSPIHYASSIDADQKQYMISGTAPEQVWPSYYDSENPIVYGAPETSKALKFHGGLAVVHEGGTLKVNSDGLHVIGATSATLFFSAATSFDASMGDEPFRTGSAENHHGCDPGC